jgi:hemolysin D
MSLASLNGAMQSGSRLLGRLFERVERRDEREFLPAALEVLETPPSPAARLVAGTIVLFFLVAGAWAFLGKVDVIATAPGHVLPQGKVKVVQPLDTGIVRAIHVQDGDRVREGQLLIELDPTTPGADRDRLAHDLVQAELDVARLTALKPIGQGRAGIGAFATPKDAAEAAVAEARAALRAQADGQAAKLAAFDQQIAQKRSEAVEAAASLAKLTSSIPMLAEKERLRRELQTKGYGTTFALLDAQQALSEARHELDVEKEREVQARAAGASLERQRDEARSAFASQTLDDLAKAQERRSELAQELVKAQTRTSETQLRAPTDGVVEQLVVHTVGGVVTPAQRLLMLVPDSQKLMVEAEVSDRDVGFLRPGQTVKIKVETFNFTRYGLLDGHVLRISRDLVTTDDRGVGDGGAVDAASERRLRAPAYLARIALDSSSLMVDGVREPLRPGMAVTAEIKTGRRTILNYLLSPLARRANESLHER